MKGFSSFILLFGFAAAALAQQDTTLLRFEDFPVKEVFRGKPESVDLSSHPKAKTYRTVLRDGAKEGPNFAGHYTIVIWGCGVSTQAFAIVDALAGKVFFSPDLPLVSYADWWEEPYGLQFKIDSKVLVVYGRRMEEDPRGIFFYVWQDNRLKFITSIIRE